MEKEIIFWQDSISMHQSAFLRSLAENKDYRISLAVWEEFPPERKSIGWANPCVGDVQVILKPDRKRCEQLLLQDPGCTTHVFSSARGHPFVKSALHKSLSTPAIISIYTEACDGKGLLGFLRLVRSKYDAYYLSRRISFLLAIGRSGVSWYAKSDYPSEKIFPFGYFVEKPCDNKAPFLWNKASKYFNIIYIGQLIPRKGWDTLLGALVGIEKHLWRLHIVGDGEDRNKFLKMCEKLDLLDNIISYGALPNLKVIEILRNMDLLVLPSRWDGWGAVINEALMCGVPVISSDQCGASILLDGVMRGEIFHANSTPDLHAALRRWIAKGKSSASQRHLIIEWSSCISGESGANYFLAVLNCVKNGVERPTPPWQE